MSEKKIQLDQINLLKSPPEREEEPFEPHTQMLSLATLTVCLLLGLLGAFLFDGQSWGINVIVFALLLVGSFLLLKKIGQQSICYSQYILMAIGLFFAITFAWRDSYVLNGLSLLGILLTINLAFTLGTRQQLQHLEVTEALEDFYGSIRYGIFSYYALFNRDIQWNEVKQRWGDFGHSLFRGVIITVPLLMVFGFLLTASDARFEEKVHNVLDWGWDAKTAGQYLLSFILSSWIAAAILRGSVLNHRLINQEPFTLPNWMLSSVEIVIILGAINLLFLSFIIVQFTYFFGGDALVVASEGPTYAEYARRGFFQLIAVALLVVVLLLLAHWMHNPLSKTEKRLYQSLAAVMVVMAMIIEASAAHRMYLYTNAYGLTELRFYSSVFMAWLVALFIWFSVTVLREQRSRFTFGAILIGLLFIGILHVINPDARIAEVNLARSQYGGQEFDANYISYLSADAVPTLLEALPNLEKSYRCQLWQSLQSHRVLQASEDWRYWHWGRSEAKQSLASSPKPSDCSSTESANQPKEQP
jgi:hypothetical protein